MYKFGIFIKFGSEENIKMLREQGIIYMNTAEYFKKCEEPERGDKDENLGMLFQPDKILLEFNHPTLGKLKIGKDDGLGQVKINEVLDKEYTPITHIFSIACINDQNIGPSKEKFFDERLYEFGDSVLFITNVEEFIKRIKKAAQEVYDAEEIILCKMKLVEYVDFKEHHGEVGPFRKSINYEHQKEWRLGFHVIDQETPYILKIGSIEDISVQLNKHNIANKIEYNSETKDLKIII